MEREIIFIVYTKNGKPTTYTHTNYNVLGRWFHRHPNRKSEKDMDKNEWNAVHFVSRFDRHSSHPNQNVAISILPKQKFQPHQMIFFGIYQFQNLPNVQYLQVK